MSVQRSRHDREAAGAGREASLTFCWARVTFCPLCALFGGGGDEAAFRMTSMQLYSRDATDVWSARKRRHRCKEGYHRSVTVRNVGL